MAAPVVLPSFMQNSSMHGSSDTDVSELTVAPNNSRFHSVAITATPVANDPITERKRLGSIGTPCSFACIDDDETGLFISFSISSEPRREQWLPITAKSLTPHHVIAQFAGVGQIRHLPAVEVVFCHAVLSKTFKPVGIAGRLRAEQAVAADFLGRAAIVNFVKLVPAAELAAETVPQQF